MLNTGGGLSGTSSLLPHFPHLSGLVLPNQTCPLGLVSCQGLWYGWGFLLSQLIAHTSGWLGWKEMSPIPSSQLGTVQAEPTLPIPQCLRPGDGQALGLVGPSGCCASPWHQPCPKKYRSYSQMISLGVFGLWMQGGRNQPQPCVPRHSLGTHLPAPCLSPLPSTPSAWSPPAWSPAGAGAHWSPAAPSPALSSVGCVPWEPRALGVLGLGTVLVPVPVSAGLTLSPAANVSARWRAVCWPHRRFLGP